MRKRLAISLTLLIATWLVVSPTVARAHSGASGVRVEQQAVFTIRYDAIQIEYISQLNRAGAYLELLRMDTNGDTEPSLAEQTAYFERQEKALTGGLEISVDGREFTLQPLGPRNHLGAVELSTPTPMLFQKLYRFEIPHGDNWRDGAVIEFHNDNYLDFSGAVTVVINPGDSADVVYDSRWSDSSNERFDAMGDPQERDVVFRYRQGTGKSDPPEEVALASNDDDSVGGDSVEPVVRPSWKAFLPSFGAILAGVGLLALVCGFREGEAPAEPWDQAGNQCLPSTRAQAAQRELRPPGSRKRVRSMIVAVTIVSASLLAWSPLGDAIRPTSNVVVPDDLIAGQMFQRLHGKIYEAFDAQTESDIYDTLAQALQGPVLDDVYHEVHAALLARTQGATRFSVRRVKPIATEVLRRERSDTPGFRVRYRWRVYGTVTHFTHTHARFNEYEAVYLVEHNGRDWRITGSEVRQNKRVSIGQS